MPPFLINAVFEVFKFESHLQLSTSENFTQIDRFLCESQDKIADLTNFKNVCDAGLPEFKIEFLPIMEFF